MPIAKFTIRIKLQMSNEHTIYFLTKIGSNYSSYYISTFVRLNILVWTKNGMFFQIYFIHFSKSDFKRLL